MIADLIMGGPDRLAPYLFLAAALFALGVFACVTRRNAVGYLMGIELMLNGANLNLVAYGRFRTESVAANAQVATLFVIALAAAEAAVALGLVYAVFRTIRDVDLDKIRSLNGERT